MQVVDTFDNFFGAEVVVRICASGHPHAKATPNSANKLLTQFKAPSTSSECKILDFISKPLTIDENSAFWGAAWGPVRCLHPFTGKRCS